MNSFHFAATPISRGSSRPLKIFKFSDVDDFRQAVRKFRVEFTPLARKISVEQAILNLPGINLNLVKSFPRLADIQLAADCTLISFAMDDLPQVRFSGIDVDRPLVFIAHGGDTCTMLEHASAEIVSIVFTPESRDRGWPETDGEFGMIPTTASALQKLRILVPEILKFASESPEAISLPEATAGIRESLLASVDEAFAVSGSSGSARSIHSARLFSIVQRIEMVVRTNLGNPIYSSELAREVGVSVRTLQDLVLRYRGMSLHRYLRLKRLWLVRRHLLAGHVSVKACALAHGFWHLSDFSRSYRLQFGESPSQTLARGRLVN